MTALTTIDGLGPGQLNIAALRNTDTNYPEEIKALYLPLPDNSLGPNAQKLEAKILDEAASRAPIDLVEQIIKELKSPTYKYDTDVRDLPCAALSKVECFATYKEGFCQYYASTMAVILRDLGVPTRIAQGFLPGSRDLNAATETVLFSNAHAWVEVYFPGYGWLPFDPTGSLSQIAPLPTGNATASASIRPLPSSSGSARPAATGRDPASRGGGGSIGGPTALGPLVAVLALLLLVVGIVAFVTWQRGPRGGTTADEAYGTVTRIASRFGFGPRPNQTVYEYAGVLSDVLPIVRPELEMVARAKVESVYAREILGDERIQSLKAAQRRLRVSLLRLAFRRRERGNKGATRRLERPAAGALLEGFDRLFVGERGQVRRQVVGTQDRATGTELDDRDPAQVHRPHPEAIERQVEQRQQHDLEDPVMPDDDRPRLVGDGVAVAGDLRAVVRAGFTSLAEPREHRGQRRPDPCRDLGECLAARCP